MQRYEAWVPLQERVDGFDLCNVGRDVNCVSSVILIGWVLID